MNEEYARGWIRLENNLPNPLELIFEPLGCPEYKIPPDGIFDIWLEPLRIQPANVVRNAAPGELPRWPLLRNVENPDPNYDYREVPMLEVRPDCVILWAEAISAVVWHNGECLDYFGDKSVPPPQPPDISKASNQRGLDCYARGWMRINNSLPCPLGPFFEPWALGPDSEISTGETCDLWLAPCLDGRTDPPSPSEPLHFQVREWGISVWADWSWVIWHDGKCIENEGDRSLPPRKPPER